jgi:hypothetical protein
MMHMFNVYETGGCDDWLPYKLNTVLEHNSSNLIENPTADCIAMFSCLLLINYMLYFIIWPLGGSVYDLIA